MKSDQEPSFHCCASNCKFTTEEAIRAKLNFHPEYGFYGACPKCGKNARFLTSPESNEIARQHPEEFRQALPIVCPGGHQGQIERWGLNFTCKDCNVIFSA